MNKFEYGKQQICYRELNLIQTYKGNIIYLNKWPNRLSFV